MKEKIESEGKRKAEKIKIEEKIEIEGARFKSEKNLKIRKKNLKLKEK